MVFGASNLLFDFVRVALQGLFLYTSPSCVREQFFWEFVFFAVLRHCENLFDRVSVSLGILYKSSYERLDLMDFAVELGGFDRFPLCSRKGYSERTSFTQLRRFIPPFFVVVFDVLSRFLL